MKKLITLSVLIATLLSMVPTGIVKAEMYPVEEVSGYLTADHLTMMVYPLTKDFFYSYFADYKRVQPAEVRTYEVTGVELGYKNLYLVADPGNMGKYSRYTVFYHTTGSKLVAIGKYDEGRLDARGNYVPSKKYYTNDVRANSGEVIAEHSVLGDFYPNKIINDLEAVQAILDYQAKNGPFVAGQEYSMLEILFDGRDDYVLGKTSAGSLVPGGGVCVMATDWMKMLTLSGAEVVEKWGHYGNTKYFENPVSVAKLPIEATDATVEWPNYDLRWIQKESGWVTVSAVVMPDGDELESEYGEELVKYDAIEIISLRMTTEKPDLSTERLEALQNAYIQYRLGNAGMMSLDDSGSRLVSRTPWAYGDSLSQLLSGIVPQERVERFADELKGDPFLKSLAELRYYANLIDPSSKTMVGDYLKSTPWYAHELSRLKGKPQQLKKLEQALAHLNAYSNTFPGQKIQCYALGILIWGMDERYANIGGLQVTYAADLVPESIRNGQKISVATNGMVVRTVQSLSEVKVGDLGVRYDTATGHVFAVVGKKTVNGETVLLIAAANQVSDGRISLFEVDNGNFDVIFGSGSNKKVVLRLGTN